MHSAINHGPTDGRAKKQNGHRKYGVRSTRNGVTGSGFCVKPFRDTDMVIIRNKYTKEVVDLEVSVCTTCRKCIMA